MPRARKHLVCLENTPYYHVTSRCVRRAFLCGVDQYSGRSFEHRRSWIEDRLRVLASLFCIDLCAYAVMSNHYHLVVRLHPEAARSWSDDEVLDRWTALYRGPLLVQRRRAGEALTEAEQVTVRAIAAVYRSRLGSLSWFMKCLNEPIARQANAEDGCTGHFWEARFHSQPLCSERALLAAMAYVDLNPIRAGIARTPEQSEYTSIRARLGSKDQRAAVSRSVASLLERSELHHFPVAPRPLIAFADQIGTRDDRPISRACLPMNSADYLQLVDATGRIVVSGKRGHIDPRLAPLLERLGFSRNGWTGAALAFRLHYRNGDLRLKRSA